VRRGGPRLWVVLVARVALTASVLLPGGRLAAQGAAPGQIEGTVTDSVHAAPLAGAPIVATRLGTEPENAIRATADRRGRFRFDRVAPGRYAVSFMSAMLDSLEFGGPPVVVSVAPGQSVRVDLAIPSSATLRATACPGVRLPDRTGALLGVVTDADTDRPLAGGRVAVAWTELAIDTVRQTVTSEERSAQAPVDSAGQYRLCGVPAGEWLVLQVQHAGRAGAVVRASVGAPGVLVRNLSFTASGARPLADASAAALDDSVAQRLLSGTASIAGTVRSTGGQPVAGAQVYVLGTAPTGRTDERGGFSLSGLPAGTHELEVRQLGFAVVRRTVELRHGRTTTTDVTLERAVALDSVRVVARRSRYSDFETRRRWSMRGKFLDEDEIESRHATTITNLVSMLPGFWVRGDGAGAEVVSTRMIGLGGMCPANVIIDGMQGQRINDVTLSQVGAIESYPSGGGPIQYGQTSCGAIVIWTKR
jgi:hypothetical protein